MPPIAYFGIESSGLTLVIDLLILFAVVLYGSLVYWTYADARRRIEDPMLIGCATAASLFPFVGTLVYVILRPPEYLSDARERELETHAAEARLQDLEESLCPHCDYRIERDFVRCPSCLRKLKERCVSCSKPLDRSWTICPYCETEVPGASQPRRGTRRGERAERAESPERAERSERSERAASRSARVRLREEAAALELGEAAVALEPETAAALEVESAAARPRAASATEAVRAPQPTTRRKGPNEPHADPGKA
jgi:Double zinc ribbon